MTPGGLDAQTPERPRGRIQFTAWGASRRRVDRIVRAFAERTSSKYSDVPPTGREEVTDGRTRRRRVKTQSERRAAAFRLQRNLAAEPPSGCLSHQFPAVRRRSAS